MREREEPDVKRVDPQRGREREGQPREPGWKPDMPPRKEDERERETQRGTGMNERDNQGGRGGMRDEMGRDE